MVFGATLIFSFICLSVANPVVGEVTLPLENFVTMLDGTKVPPENPPPKLPGYLSLNYVILDLRVQGEVAVESRDTMAQLRHNFHIQVLQDQWTLFPLFSSNVITNGYRITYENGTEVSSDVAFVKHIADEMMVYLVINRADRYKVETVVYRPIKINRNLFSLEMSEAHHVTKLNFSIVGAEVEDVGISPQAVITSSTPVAGTTNLDVLLQSTTQFSISWRDGNKTTEEEKENQSSYNIPQITVLHQILHSIEDTTIQTTAFFNYDSEIDAMKDITIKIHGKNVRVIRVTGLYLDQWSTESLPGCDGAEPCLLLKVSLKNSVSTDTYQLVVSTEHSVGETPEFSLITFECMGVLRQQGQVGIIKAANIEVHEVEKYNVATAEPMDLSDFLRDQTSKNILLAYSFLHPEYVIVLKKERHERINTLDTSVEHAFVQVLVSEDHALTKFIMKLTNSNRQYLRLTVPPNTQAVWSVHVAGEPVKASTDANGLLLIPLTYNV